MEFKKKKYVEKKNEANIKHFVCLNCVAYFDESPAFEPTVSDKCGQPTSIVAFL